MSDYRELNNRCVYRYQLRATQMFLFLDALDLENPAMKLRFEKYDRGAEPGSRVTRSIDVYLPVQKFLMLAQRLTDGSLLSRPSPFFEHYSGTKADGKLVSKHMTILPGKGSQYAFFAEQMEGERGKNNLIVPASGSQQDKVYVYLSPPDDDVLEFAMVGKAYAEAFVQTDLQRRLAIIRKHRRTSGAESMEGD